MVPGFFISSATHLPQLFLVCPVFFFFLGVPFKGRVVGGWFPEGVSYPCPLPLFNLFLDAALVCPPLERFVCDLVLPFNFENVSDTFAYKCLEFSGCCLSYSLCLRAVEQHAFHIGVADSDFVSC